MTLLRHMRGPASLALLLLASMRTVSADNQTIRVEIDRARIVKLPQGAQTLVIGNPVVADVTMLKANQLMVVTGRSFGSTNLVVLDRVGSQIGESYITVVPSAGKVVVQRGAHRESLSCQPDCSPTVNLGDDEQYLKNVIDAAKTYEGASASRK